MSAERQSRGLAWGQVLRLSLAPSAAADAAAGVLLGAAGWPLTALSALPMLASLAVYHGGMGLNDWADREEDARARPGRPIPSGRLSARAVLVVSIVLLLLGPLLAWTVSPLAAAALGATALAAALYDTLGRGALVGPLLLGACRFGNVSSGLLAGLALAGREGSLDLLALPALYAVYVFVLSVLGRREDDLEREPGRFPARVLHVASLCLVAAPVAGAIASDNVDPLSPHLAGAAALAIWSALGLQRAAAREGDWKREEVVVVMGLLLRRLLILTASASLATGASGSPVVAAAILAGFWISHRLRQVFPPS